jgi:uroporphyrinogen-III synthase
MLRSAGFQAVQRALLRYEFAPAAVRAAMPELERADWLLLTSATAVRALLLATTTTGARAVRGLQSGHAWPPQLRAACVGSATADAAARAGLDVALVPRVHDSASLADALLDAGAVDGRRFFWPRAQAAPDDLANALRRGGGTVTAVTAYRSIVNECGVQRLRRDIERRRVDAVLLFSPSAVDAYVDRVGLAAGLVTGVVGATTAAHARTRGVNVDVEPAVPGTAALVAALRRHAGSDVA